MHQSKKNIFILEQEPVIRRINQISIIKSHDVEICVGLIINFTPLISHFYISITSL